ncbi:MAG: glycerol-3-phosphate dehydrogenase [Rhizobiaceae bacterium]
MRQTENHYNVLIIGGGINGCGIARDAVGRGYSVCLCEENDLAGGTSSASTKLIHGGLRYLEHYEFRLVRESLMEREVIWKMAPHIVKPLRFILPHHKGLRPKWLLRLGLFFYDYIGGRKLLPASTSVDLQSDEAGKSLKPEFETAFEYSDCWVDDSRLVILNAMDAAERGAVIRTQTKVLSARYEDEKWQVTIEKNGKSKPKKITADLIVNAAGPWVDEVLRTVFGMNNVDNVRLVRGSHIVIKKKFQHDKCYIFQNADDRIVFAIPYEDEYTLIGTTDAEHCLEDGKPKISPEETTYLCQLASDYFKEPVLESDIVWTYSGVRPLYNDGASAAQEATRDYVLVKDKGQPLINIFGGKITTYRKLAESMMVDIASNIKERGAPWTKETHLPGGDCEVNSLEQETAKLKGKYPFLEAEHASRLIRTYGTRAAIVLGDASDIADLGTCFGGDLYRREVEYLKKHEWARSAEDVLFRRTKLGIKFSKKQTAKLAKFFG